MARYRDYSYQQCTMVPISLERQIQEGTIEYAINHIVDNEIDLSIFDKRYINDETGAPAISPVILLKIILFAYSRGIIHSRKIARACEENVVFMALSAETKPHFTTIANFISSMNDEVAVMFRDIVTLCYSEGLIGRNMFAIDGCKISSNSSKEWSGSLKDLNHKKEKFEHSIRYLLRKHRKNDENPVDEEQISKENKAIRNMRKRVKYIKEFLNTNTEDKKGKRNRIKQSNITDNDSAKMPSSHGVIQGYTAIAAVDEQKQCIVHAKAHGDAHEADLLKPTLNGMYHNCKQNNTDVTKEATILADTAYHNESNAEFIIENNIDAIIPDNNFRKRDPSFRNADRFRKSTDRDKSRYAKKKFHKQDFILNKKTNTLMCPAGKILHCINENFRNTSGLIGPQYKADTKECLQCVFKKKCLQGKTGRTVVLSKERAKDAPITYCQQMINRFDTERSKHLYSRRMGIVEPVFANIRNALGLQRFSLRSKKKVNIQWNLFCIVHNIGKLSRYAPRFA